jgi:hypothetical protein
MPLRARSATAASEKIQTALEALGKRFLVAMEDAA